MKKKHSFIAISIVVVVAVSIFMFFGDELSPKLSVDKKFSETGSGVIEGSNLIGSTLSVSGENYKVVDVRPPLGSDGCYINVDSLKSLISDGAYLSFEEGAGKITKSISFLDQSLDDYGNIVCEFPCSDYGMGGPTDCCIVMTENYA